MENHLKYTGSNNYEIVLNKGGRLIDVQDEFSILYPYLKLEFLTTDKSGKTLKSMKIDPHTSLKQLTTASISDKINVNQHRTVSELSHDFEHILGVIVQVYRKSGNVWNVISITDGWTLESQNAAGEFISTEIAMTARKIAE